MTATVQRGDKLIVKKGAMVYGYGDIPGDRYKRTSRANLRRRHITVDLLEWRRYEPDGEGNWIDVEGPFVTWAGAHGYWHWCLLADCELP